jgi:hypothetical protein
MMVRAGDVQAEDLVEGPADGQAVVFHGVAAAIAAGARRQV